MDEGAARQLQKIMLKYSKLTCTHQCCFGIEYCFSIKVTFICTSHEILLVLVWINPT